MKFAKETASLVIPDSAGLPFAVARTTHLGVGAHQDDLEFMALHGILECFRQNDRWFGGVTCTDGSGSSRSGSYANLTDDQMKVVRAQEQDTAARIGQYSFMAQLDHPSSVAKRPGEREPMVDDLVAVLQSTQPEVIYTHNPFDKHATHVGVLFALLQAVRRLPVPARPRAVFGCEVWRGLDWLPDKFKVVHGIDGHLNLAASLNGAFDSQIAGGKRYDLAVEGRRLANATFHESHAVDEHAAVAYAVDLTPLVTGDHLTVEAFTENILRDFSQDIRDAREALEE
jgi:LmbE family N-acetylglucosaminyl deacetylase